MDMFDLIDLMLWLNFLRWLESLNASDPLSHIELVFIGDAIPGTINGH